MNPDAFFSAASVSPHRAHAYHSQSDFKFLQMFTEEFAYDSSQNKYAMEVGCRRIPSRDPH